MPQISPPTYVFPDGVDSQRRFGVLRGDILDPARQCRAEEKYLTPLDLFERRAPVKREKKSLRVRIRRRPRQSSTPFATLHHSAHKPTTPARPC